MNRRAWLTTAVFVLAAGTAHAAPSALSCAAVYGVIHDRGPSLRADAAAKAREALIADYAALLNITVEAAAPDVARADAALQANMKSGNAFPDDDSLRCDLRYNLHVASLSPEPLAAKGSGLVSILNAPAQGSIQPPAASGPKFSGAGIHSSCEALMEEGIDPNAAKTEVQARARQLGCTQADIDSLGMVYDMLGKP